MPSHVRFDEPEERSAALSLHQPVLAERAESERDREPVSCHDYDRVPVDSLSAPIDFILSDQVT